MLLWQQELVEKKARKGGYQKITDDDLKELGFASAAELGAALAEGKAIIIKIKTSKTLVCFSTTSSWIQKKHQETIWTKRYSWF